MRTQGQRKIDKDKIAEGARGRTSRLKLNRFEQTITPRSALLQPFYYLPPRLIPRLHPPIHLRVAPTYNIGQGNIARCLRQVTCLTMFDICILSEKPVTPIGTLEVRTLVSQRRVWEMVPLDMSFYLFVSRACPRNIAAYLTISREGAEIKVRDFFGFRLRHRRGRWLSDGWWLCG